MSRIAKAPVSIPSGVEIKLDGNSLTVKGTKGQLSHVLNSSVNVVIIDNILQVQWNLEDKKATAQAGTARAILFIGSGASLTNVNLNDRTTSLLVEGSNLYYTQQRIDSEFDTRLATKSTSQLQEGSNLYYTQQRVDTEFDTRLATKTTTQLTKGTNLYYTSSRANVDFDTRLATKNLDDIALKCAEHSDNK